MVASYHRIPSDLHVLGLPLAFILSQDQTLHCKMKFLIPTIYIIRILFYISDLGPNWTNSWICSWLSTFVCLLVTLTWLCFLKELLRFNFRIRYIPMGTRPLFIFFLFPSVSVGTAKVEIFFELPKNFWSFFLFLFPVSAFKIIWTGF